MEEKTAKEYQKINHLTLQSGILAFHKLTNNKMKHLTFAFINDANLAFIH